jgi:two-component sensor histidine kinase
MSEFRKRISCRRGAVKIAVIFLVWTTLTTVFAGQFYWIGHGLPFKISWRQAFHHAFTEWCPWLILCPLVLWLAERFRFERGRWVWGILPHLPACVLVALAYHGISVLLWPQMGGIILRTEAGQVQSAMIPPTGVMAGAAGDVPTSRETRGVIFGQGGIALHYQRRDISSAQSDAENKPSFEIESIPQPLALGAGELAPPFLPVMPGPWMHFFHVAFGRAQSTIPIYWVIVCVTWVIRYYQQLRERERRTLELETRLTKANLQTLKAQLQPHFLFNTLNAIASLVRNKPEAAEDMLGSLSDFLRMNLDTAHQHEVPLRREMEFLDLYLLIQQTRFGERLRVRMEIDPAALVVAVPTLILQPLAENSVRHGIEPRETGGTVMIRAVRHGDSLRLEVSDDGEGLQTGHLAALRDGIGLSNTKARLLELYGDQHRFHLTPNPERGLTVTVELPWRESVARDVFDHQS